MSGIYYVPGPAYIMNAQGVYGLTLGKGIYGKVGRDLGRTA